MHARRDNGSETGGENRNKINCPLYSAQRPVIIQTCGYRNCFFEAAASASILTGE